MNTDFRLSTGIFEHVKFMELGERLGAEGEICLIKLFRYVAVNRPDGVLTGMKPRAIERAVAFRGADGEFVAALCEIGWLDTDESGVHSVHDWEEHNPWACKAKERTKKASTAAVVRWEKERQARIDAEQCRIGATSNATSTGLAMPLSSPLPSLPIHTYPNQETPPIPPVGEAVAEAVPAPAGGGSAGAVAARGVGGYVKRESVIRALRSIPAEMVSTADDFERFYGAYPRKEAPGNAWTEWITMFPPGKPPDDADGAAIMESLAEHCASDQWQDRSKIPHPATWIKERRWEGEAPPKAKARAPTKREIEDAESQAAIDNWMSESKAKVRLVYQ